MLNLSGCTYDRIQVNWEPFLKKRDHSFPLWKRLLRRRPFSSRIEFDLQPYNQLEGVFRTMGKDREADRIYLQRCRVERDEKWKRGRHVKRMGWVASALYGLFANYGVRPIRLAVISSVLVLVGAFVFWQPGAVKPAKDDSAKTAVSLGARPTSAQTEQTRGTQIVPLSFAEAAAVSVHQFLPVDIPLGAEWKPESTVVLPFMRSDAYASILKIFGWILVPVGIAAITGVLRRVSG
jgi:hypothetical protein